MSEQATQTKPQAVTFYSNHPHCQYIFKSGQPAWFIDHLFKTSDPAKIAELQAEITAGHPSIRLAGAEENTEHVLDEFDITGGLKERIRRQIIEEEKAKIRAASDKSRDMGTYQAPTTINPVSSNDGPIALEASAIVNATAATEAAAAVENVQTTPTPTASRAKLQSLLNR